jgi:hypothetical protein
MTWPSVIGREMQSRLRRSAWASCETWYRDGGRITTRQALALHTALPAGADGHDSAGTFAAPTDNVLHCRGHQRPTDNDQNG